MQASDWYQLAQQLGKQNTEAHWRTAANRAYYFLFIETRNYAIEHLGLRATKLQYHEKPHRYLIDYLSSKADTDPSIARRGDLMSLSVNLRLARDIRHHADYNLERTFNRNHVEQSLRIMQAALDLIARLKQ